MVSPTTVAPSREHTQIAFDVKNVRAEMDALERVGVDFEDYEATDFKSKGHVATMGRLKVAWFKDSEGNLLSLVEGVRTAATTPKAD